MSTRLGFERAEIYIPFVLLAYTVGHILNFLSSVTVERYSIWSSGYPSKYLLAIRREGYFEIKENRTLRACIRVLVWLMLLPFTFIDAVVGGLLGFRALYAKPLDPLLGEIVRKKMCALLIYHGDMENPPHSGDAASHDFFRYVYHHAVEHAHNHLPKMQNYVALYGFLRTLTLLSVIATWGLLVAVYSETIASRPAYLSITAASLTSFTLYMAFVKFYRRFSLEALMAMTAVYEVPPPSANANGVAEKASNPT